MTLTTFLIFAACLWRILTLAADLSISGTLLYQERVWFRVERYREKLRGPVLDLFVVSKREWRGKESQTPKRKYKTADHFAKSKDSMEKHFRIETLGTLCTTIHLWYSSYVF